MIDFLPQIQFIFMLWFLVFYLLPVIIILRYNRIDIELFELKGLELTPQKLDNNIVGVSNNYEAYIQKHPNLKKSNVIIKILKDICSNAGKGIFVNPNLYISSYRSTLRKYVLWLLLGSHIPLLFLLFTQTALLAEIVKYQICCYILIYILEMIFQYKHALFTKIFYANWYNKILNFDLLTVKMIRNDVEQITNLSNSHDLLESINKFETINAELSNNLISHSKMLSDKLDELLKMQQKMNGINSQSILLSLDDSVARYREINAHIQVVSESIRNSVDCITKLTEERKDEINAINKNSGLLSDMRDRFINYQSEAFKAELAHLQQITTSIDNNAGKAFASAGNVITQNFVRLEEGYDRFFDMCKSLSTAISNDYEEKTASALKIFLDNLISEFSEMKKQTEKSVQVIENTSQSTELLCKTVYDFTQFTMAPDFMSKISKFGTFSARLKDAAEKLLSYEKLASLGDGMTDSRHQKENQNTKDMESV